MRRIAEVLVLAGIVVFGAVMRFGGIAVPSLWLDEILDYDVATKLTHEPFWRWLTGFASEHGPLFFVTELAGRFAHAPELAARFAPAVFGVLAIVIAALGVSNEASERITFALLLAGSPLAIYYSREARPYALLMLLATAMLALLLRASAPPRETVLPFAIPLLALFATSGSAPLLVASALTAAIAFAITRRRFFAIYAIASIIAAALIPLLYRRMPGNAAALGFRPLSARFFQRLLQSFSIGAVDVTTIHRAAYVVAALALIGAVALVLRDRVRGAIVIGMAVLPITVSVAALWKLRHWYAVRYVATALPAYLLLAAIGITTLLRLILRGRTAIAIPIAALIAAGFVVREGWPAAQTEPYRKLNWRVIAATLHEHAHARDAVVTTNDWSYVCLDFYLRRLPPHVRLISAGESSSRAASVVAHNEPVWIVSAGFHRPGDIGDWACQYPVVLASPLESFRLAYANSLRHLLINRLTSADTRALVARYPSQVMHLGPESDFFLGDGWFGAEGTGDEVARWTDKDVSALLIASSAIDHRLLLRMMPFEYRASPPQIATISLNAAPLARLTLATGWHDCPLDVPRAKWRDGVNYLTISFSRADAPASIDPASSTDHRSLAARFSLIAVTPLNATKLVDSLPELTRSFRINEPGEFLDENSLWYGRRHGAPAPPPLLARIGVDPSRRVAADDVAETVAYDSDCLNDSDFLHIAYATILARPIDPAGERYFLGALKKKETRVGVARALVESAEFKKR